MSQRGARATHVGWLAGLCGSLLAGSFASAQIVPSPPAPPAEEVAPFPTPFYVGNAGCSAASCHGGRVSPGGEFNHWISYDRPHVEAYQALFSERGVRMARLLGLTAAHESQRCLACHSYNAGRDDLVSAPTAALEYGVSCESCHGPAGAWVGLHVQAGWRDMPGSIKSQLGFRNTRLSAEPSAVSERIGMCVDCHVGSDRGVVDHDLIAAGHPRLHFEAATYHAMLPKHWSTAREQELEPALEAKLWMLGEVATARRAAELVSHRLEQSAGGDAPAIPDLAEFDCFACHHGLADAAWRQRQAAGPGGGFPRWQTWIAPPAIRLASNSATFGAADGRTAAEALSALAQRMERGQLAGVPRDELAPLVQAAIESLTSFETRLQTASWSPTQFDAWIQLEATVAAEDPLGWDDATRRYLSVAALRHARARLMGANPMPLRHDPGFVQRLQFPVGFDSPLHYNPEGLTPLWPAIRAQAGGR